MTVARDDLVKLRRALRRVERAGAGKVTDELRELAREALALTPEPGEKADEKAGRLLGSGRLTVTVKDGDRVYASCVGDHGIYELGYDADARRWSCTCPAYGEDCSHLIALRLVVLDQAPPPLDRPAPTLPLE